MTEKTMVPEVRCRKCGHACVQARAYIEGDVRVWRRTDGTFTFDTDDLPTGTPNPKSGFECGVQADAAGNVRVTCRDCGHAWDEPKTYKPFGKVRVMFKSPNAVIDAGENLDERTYARLQDLAPRFTLYGEYVTVEFDLDAATCRVVPNSEKPGGA